MNLKNLIANRNELNRKIAAVKVGRLAVGCTVKIKGTANLPWGVVNREMNGYGGDGAFINFTITKKAGNTLYVIDNSGWNRFRSIKVKTTDVFGTKA